MAAGKHRSADHSRRGLIFHAATRMQAVINPVASAAIGIDSAKAAVAAAMMTPEAVTAAWNGEAKISATISGAKIAPIAINTTSILARVTREGGSGAVATRSAASSPDMVSHARPPASWPAAITITGVISTMV